MRTRFSIAAWAAASLAVATPASPQAAGSIEFGGFGRFTQFDNSLSFSDRAGAGGRLGFFLTRNVELEASVGYTSTSSATGPSVDHYPIYGRLVFNAPLVSNVALLLGGGFVQNIYRGGLRGADNGASGLAGFRVFLTNAISLRLEGVGDYTPNPTNNATSSSNINLGAQAGLSIHFGNYRAAGSTRPARRGSGGDSDGDGVADGSDSCRNTAAGVPVDRVGCPLPIDTDQDGVLDAADRCPNTTPGARVDGSGCEAQTAVAAAADADRDGIADTADSCPNTPAGTPVDAAGCPRATDADADGVADAIDICANTPAGIGVDARGCPADSDRDGVADAIDQCQSTPPGTYVGPDGCATLLPSDNRPVVLEGVNFNSGSAAVTGSSAAVLDWVARALIAEREVLIEIGGHTDNTGSRATNLSLSRRRADAVRSYLVQRGVPSNQLVSRGYGPDSPIASNATAGNRARNRRVELRRIN